MTRRDWGTTNKPESDVEGKYKMNQNPYHPLDWYFYYILLISAAKIGINIADMGPMGQRNTFMNLKSAAQCQRILIFETRKHHQNFELC